MKPSPDHKWFGPHDLVNVEVVESADATLPAGLRFAIRRPHDGSADVRSPERRARDADNKSVPVPGLRPR